MAAAAVGGARGALMDRLINKSDAVRSEATIQSDVRMLLLDPELGLAERALYVERATMSNQKIVPLSDVEPMSSPYFSLIIVPGERWQG